MSDRGDTREVPGSPGRFHQLLDWSLFPASVAAVSVTGFSLVFGAVMGRSGSVEGLEVAVAVVSALIASFVKRPR